jgi:type II secretory pathway predicted ATPase ExeA
MEPIYQEHFGLRCAPFNVTPDPSFLYLSASHREAFAQLSYGIKARKGFVVLSGEVGTGKTTLVHALLDELNGDTQTALIFNRVVSSEDLLRYVCEDFGLVESERDHRGVHDYLTLLNRFLLESYRKGNNVALVIDEAQNLDAEVLESIRLLSNFETSRDKLLQILLVGQPELVTRLNSPELRQLKQRVALRHHLLPLNFAECREYIARRMEVAGGNTQMFASQAFEAVYVYSGGTPRLVNILCDNGMLTAYALSKREVTAEMIQEVAGDLNLVSSTASRVFHAEPKMRRAGAPDASREPGVARAYAIPGSPRFSLDGSAPESLGDGQESVFPGFLDRMGIALTEAMGPIASLVVRDQIAALGERYGSFPRARVAELIDLVGQEILNEKMKETFRKTMAEQIRFITAGKDNK